MMAGDDIGKNPSQLAEFLYGLHTPGGGMIYSSRLLFNTRLKSSRTANILLKRNREFSQVVPETCKLSPFFATEFSGKRRCQSCSSGYMINQKMNTLIFRNMGDPVFQAY